MKCCEYPSWPHSVKDEEQNLIILFIILAPVCAEPTSLCHQQSPTGVWTTKLFRKPLSEPRPRLSAAPCCRTCPAHKVTIYLFPLTFRAYLHWPSMLKNSHETTYDSNSLSFLGQYDNQ